MTKYRTERGMMDGPKLRLGERVMADETFHYPCPTMENTIHAGRMGVVEAPPTMEPDLFGPKLFTVVRWDGVEAPMKVANALLRKALRKAKVQP